MLKFSPALKQLLVDDTTKVEWAETLKTALGPTRRLRCWHSATVVADASVSGTEFLNTGLTGEITIAGGKITSFGVATDTTIKLAATLSTGSAVLRVEGNGHWMQGTVGLTGAATDFHFTANPTGAAGTGFATTLRTNPPNLLASGTGYLPPNVDADTPTYATVWNWSNPSAVVEAGRIHFNKRIANWVFQDAEFAANMGDLRVTQSTDMVTYGAHEFGAMLLSANPAVNATAGKVRHDVVINFKPTEANWPNYPRQTGAARGGYLRGTRVLEGLTVNYGISNTFMNAFKVSVHRADGTVLGWCEMPRDGLAINSSELSDVPTKTKPVRPRTHCASLLAWSSHASKMNSYAAKYFPGVDAQFLRPSLSKERTAANAMYPLQKLTQIDSNLHWYGMGKWAQPCSSAAAIADEASRTDPYLWNIGPTNATYNDWGTKAWATPYFGVPESDYGFLTHASVLNAGWGYEPGSYTGHDMLTGPGGKRIDRAVMPSPIAIHLTDPNWVHLRDNTPISVMVQDWNKGYFNHAIHFFDGDIRNFSTVPTQEAVDGLWCHGEVYYNGAMRTFTDLDHAIPQFSIGAGPTEVPSLPHLGAFTDTNYRMPWNGYSHDWFHNYNAVGFAALFYNSPAHLVSQKHRYLASIMMQGSGTRPDALWQSFLVRNQAWLFAEEARMWKLASDHPLGVSREVVEARIEAGLVSLYNNITVPLEINNSQTMFFRGIRNLGIATEYNTTYGWYPKSFSLQYYMAHALQFWRQSGLWGVMYNRSEVCRRALMTLINALDKGCLDYYLDTDGAYSGEVYNAGIDLWIGNRMTNNDSIEIATSWADWQARKTPKASTQEDLIHNAAGALRQPDVGEFSRMQWPFIRRDYFPDIPALRDVNACCAKVTNWQGVWNTHIATMEGNGTSKRAIAQADWGIHPALGRILPPTVLGA